MYWTGLVMYVWAYFKFIEKNNLISPLHPFTVFLAYFHEANSLIMRLLQQHTFLLPILTPSFTQKFFGPSEFFKIVPPRARPCPCLLLTCATRCHSINTWSSIVSNWHLLKPLKNVHWKTKDTWIRGKVKRCLKRYQSENISERSDS